LNEKNNFENYYKLESLCSVLRTQLNGAEKKIDSSGCAGQYKIAQFAYWMEFSNSAFFVMTINELMAQAMGSQFHYICSSQK
jgi:hypothetical protein